MGAPGPPPPAAGRAAPSAGCLQQPAVSTTLNREDWGSWQGLSMPVGDIRLQQAQRLPGGNGCHGLKPTAPPPEPTHKAPPACLRQHRRSPGSWLGPASSAGAGPVQSVAAAQLESLHYRVFGDEIVSSPGARGSDDPAPAAPPASPAPAPQEQLPEEPEPAEQVSIAPVSAAALTEPDVEPTDTVSETRLWML